RWKRCVQYVDDQLGEALGQEYVRKNFPPQTKAATLKMTQEIEAAMALRIQQLDWMSPATKQQAMAKLHAVVNKIGYPDKWRDDSGVKITRDALYGTAKGGGGFEGAGGGNKGGKAGGRSGGGKDAAARKGGLHQDDKRHQLPAGVLQPPLYDPKMDDAPNYG